MIAASMWSRNRLCLWFLNLAFKSFGCLLLLSIWMKMQRMDVWDSLFIWYSKMVSPCSFELQCYLRWMSNALPRLPQNEQCRAHFGEFLQGYRSSAESVEVTFSVCWFYKAGQALLSVLQRRLQQGVADGVNCLLHPWTWCMPKVFWKVCDSNSCFTLLLLAWL